MIVFHLAFRDGQTRPQGSLLHVPKVGEMGTRRQDPVNQVEGRPLIRNVKGRFFFFSLINSVIFKRTYSKETVTVTT